MAERTAFVTGGSGFIGGRLIRRLAADGWRVRALARSDRAARAVEDAGAEAVRGDLDQVEAMRSAVVGRLLWGRRSHRRPYTRSWYRSQMALITVSCDGRRLAAAA